ncbi:14087_t:CDS:1, partial [Funneliformis geosporum]
TSKNKVMTEKWCINCKKTVKHLGCQAEECKDNCNHCCVMCGKNALASIIPNQNDVGYSLIKQMVGEAQRKAIRTGEIGDIEVSRTIINSNGEYHCQILVYNTNNGIYRSS